MNVHFQYLGKLPESQILAQTPCAQLKLVKLVPGQGELDGWKNMLILGDNLPVLKSLLKDFREKIKLVYIDPPFSTGQEYRIGKSKTGHVSSDSGGELAFSDKLKGIRYLEDLRQRLILLKELLAQDGSIYVHLDIEICHYVRLVMDEIFGEENFINQIARIKSNPKNFPRKAYGNIHDIILFYSKGQDYVWNYPRQPYTQDQIQKLFPKIDPSGRRYTTNPLHAPGETKNGATGKPWRGIPPPPGRHWRYPPEELEKLDAMGLIEWSPTGVPRKKIYADEFIQKGIACQDVWEFKDPAYPEYPTQKNLEMLKRIVSASSNPGDIVLDCYAGSGTTLVAAEELGRRWIGIEMSPVGIQIAAKRLKSIPNHKSFAIYESDSYMLPQALKEIL